MAGLAVSGQEGVTLRGVECTGTPRDGGRLRLSSTRLPRNGKSGGGTRLIVDRRGHCSWPSGFPIDSRRRSSDGGVVRAENVNNNKTK